MAEDEITRVGWTRLPLYEVQVRLLCSDGQRTACERDQRCDALESMWPPGPPARLSGTAFRACRKVEIIVRKV